MRPRMKEAANWTAPDGRQVAPIKARKRWRISRRRGSERDNLHRFSDTVKVLKEGERNDGKTVWQL
jgi:hypothetical protein